MSDVLAQGVEHPADAAIEGMDHRGVDAQTVLFDVRQGVVVGLQRLQRRMHGPVREVEEEGPIPVGLDDLDGLVGVVVGQVAARLELGAAVERCGELHGSPQELVDAVEVLLRVDDIGVVLGEVQATRHEQALVETLVVGRHAAAATEVPLADVHAVVTRGSEQLGKGDLGRGHAHVRERHRGPGFVDERLAQDARPGVAEQGNHRAEGGRRRRELEAEAGAVAAGHQGGARGRAGTVGRVAVRELNPPRGPTRRCLAWARCRRRRRRPARRDRSSRDRPRG